ncbi:MAG: tetratricopeptide repeat protein [Burkholderiales bacterium]
MRVLAVAVAIGALLLASCATSDLAQGIKSHERNDYPTAVNAFRRAAANGNAEAQRRLAFMYYHGEGVAQDNKQAVTLFEQAAEAGDAESASNLARMYEFGMGVGQDDSRAAEWYRKAAELGEPSSQYRLSAMYYQAQGVTRDCAEAAKWWTLAMAHGGEWTERIRASVKSVESKLTEEEITEGKRRAAEWLKDHQARK